MSTTRNLAILIFEDVEVLDFCGPFEVFSVASHFTEPPAFHVFTVAERPGPVVTRGGLSVNPLHRLADCPGLICCWFPAVRAPGGRCTTPC
jgi:transcriptional regulator GlxA family with amidase domain